MSRSESQPPVDDADVEEGGEGDERETVEDDEQKSLGFFELLGSTLAAAFGVQSSRNRARDFRRGRPGQFIAMGIAFTVVFVIAMIFLVNLVLSVTS